MDVYLFIAKTWLFTHYRSIIANWGPIACYLVDWNDNKVFMNLIYNAVLTFGDESVSWFLYLERKFSFRTFILSSILVVMLLIHSGKKVLLTPFLLNHVWIHPSKPVRIQDFALSKSVRLFSLNLVHLVLQ